MNIIADNDNGICRVQIEGEMSIFNANEIKKQMLESLAECSGVEMDLSQVTEMDSSGFQLLCLAKKESLNKDRTFRIISHSPAVLSVLELFNVNKEYL